jgi:S-adenosylmethionine:tRNA ribosyltransferase-isomerase
MPTPVTDFDYALPPDLIAQSPIEPRDASRLLVLDRVTGEVQHRPQFSAILDELKSGDVLVFNSSKVFKARLFIEGHEVFVLKVRDGEIDALVKGSRKFPIGSVLGSFQVLAKTDDGIVTLKTGLPMSAMFDFCNAQGEVPTPPYMPANASTLDRYQTVYAKTTGSVAAPTAGLHFTPELIEAARSKGVQIEEITLHVGIGTFRPVQADNIEDHTMHAEFVEIDASTTDRINAAKAEGRRIIAVGTTTIRALEGVSSTRGQLETYCGELNIFITPGFQFQIIDAVITNFHLPKSTLLMLISAFAGREHVLAAYAEAIERRYRFFSFGDAMFIR